MSYLIAKDYSVSIQDINISQIIQSDETIRMRAQLAGEAEAQSYLKQKYFIDREFAALLPWSYGITYKGLDRFYLDATAYSATALYALHSLTLNAGKVYICSTAITVVEVFTPAHWTLLGNQYDIFFAQLPYPEFLYSAYYNKGDVVFWNDKNYTCQVTTPLLSHDTVLQYRNLQNIPLLNPAPDDVQQGLAVWGTGTLYSVPAGTLPTNTTYYILFDPRDAQMVLYLCDIVLFHLHSRIAPRNIPDIRVKRYDAAIEWLKMCATGEVTPNLPLIQPKQGNRLRYGGSVRNINSY